MDQEIASGILDKLKEEVNALLGFHDDTPRINYGPCGVFAKLFFDAWNNRFSEKVHICFIMTMNHDECDHIVIRLPWGELYDGGVGIHTNALYTEKFLIEDMVTYDHERLEKWSYGLDRIYPRFCPNFDKESISNLIKKHLNHLNSITYSLNHLKKTIINANGQAGERWYNNLLYTIKNLATHWSLSNIQPVLNMSWNYVAFAEQNDHRVVLKISADAKTIEHEYQALHHFSGVGVIKIIDYYPKLQALLLEQAVPGCLLKNDHSHDIQTVMQIYADVVKKLSLPTPAEHTFQHAKDWCKVIDDMNDPRIPTKYIHKAKEIRKWLFDIVTHEYICHGDLHLENIIKHEKQWLAIDPKGIVGEMAFEAAAFDLLNEDENNISDVTNLLKERIQQLASALSLNEERLKAWIFLRIMLSIQWSVEDKGDPTKMLKMADNIYPLMQQIGL